MRKFFTKILFFVLPIILIAMPLDYFISSNLKKSVVHVDGEFLVWNDIYSDNIDVDIAIYGSSRAWVHISPVILKDSLGIDAYNFGIDALNFKFQYFRHQQYLKYNPKPNYIIVSGDSFSFEREEGFYNYEQILPYMLFDKDYLKNRKTFNVYSWFDYYVPLLRYFGQTWDIVRAINVAVGLENDPPARIDGYMGMNRPWNDDLENAKDEYGTLKVKIDDEQIALFDRFLIECEDSGIQVILVYSPSYFESRKFINNHEEIINVWEEFAAIHDLLFLDYTQDTMCYNRDYFYNSSHLNKTGSELFSSKLAIDLKPFISH